MLLAFELQCIAEVQLLLLVGSLPMVRALALVLRDLEVLRPHH
jgi:hypothetical protein